MFSNENRNTSQNGTNPLQRQTTPLSAQIQSAIDANTTLQNELRIRLQKITQRKKQNRLEAIQLVRKISILQTTGTLEYDEKNKCYTNNPNSQSQHFRFYRDFQNEIEWHEKNRQNENNGQGVVVPPETFPIIPNNAGKTRKLKLQWIYDETRRRYLRYFQDATESVPMPNADTVKRRRLEGKDYPHYTTDLRWSSTELDILKKNVDTVKTKQYVRNQHGPQISQQQNKDPSVTELDSDCDGVAHQRKIQQQKYENKNDCHPPNERTEKEADVHNEATSLSQSSLTNINESKIDFNKVAELLNTEMHKDRWSKKFNKSLHIPRTPTQCRLTYINYLSPMINKTKWTKSESLKILEIVHKEKDFPAWDQVAISLGTNRTPWQCFQYYQKFLNSKIKYRPWRKEEDELLFKYIVARGPQYVINVASCKEIAKRFFPERSAKQIYIRANFSMVNPNFNAGIWSSEMEMKLALCMKVYKDHPNFNSKLAKHFPGKSPKRIAEKWERGLNPIFDVETPFTKEEDTLLLETVDRLMTQHNSSWNISDFGFLFPTRRPRCLFQRWLTLASEEKLVEKYSYILKKQGGTAARGLMDLGNAGALFSPDDFVVRIKES